MRENYRTIIICRDDNLTRIRKIALKLNNK